MRFVRSAAQTGEVCNVVQHRDAVLTSSSYQRKILSGAGVYVGSRCVWGSVSSAVAVRCRVEQVSVANSRVCLGLSRQTFSR